MIVIIVVVVVVVVFVCFFVFCSVTFYFLNFALYLSAYGHVGFKVQSTSSRVGGVLVCLLFCLLLLFRLVWFLFFAFKARCV